MTIATLLFLVSSTIMLPRPSGAIDGESSTNTVLALRSDGNLFHLTFAIQATLSNNVDVAFGIDRNADCDLSTDETEFLIGWRGDRWVAFDTTSEQITECVSQGGLTKLDWTVRLRNGTAAPRALTASLNGSAAFSAWAAHPPRCLFNPEWTLAKVFVRGEGPVEGRISCRRKNQGFVLMIR